MAFSRSESLSVPALGDDQADETAPAVTPDLSELTEREQTVLVGRSRGETLSELGSELGISQERVRQVHAKAIKKARRKKGNVALACIRDLVKRRGYRKPAQSCCLSRRAPIPVACSLVRKSRPWWRLAKISVRSAHEARRTIDWQARNSTRSIGGNSRLERIDSGENRKPKGRDSIWGSQTTTRTWRRRFGSLSLSVVSSSERRADEGN